MPNARAGSSTSTICSGRRGADRRGRRGGRRRPMAVPARLRRRVPGPQPGPPAAAAGVGRLAGGRVPRRRPRPVRLRVQRRLRRPLRPPDRGLAGSGGRDARRGLPVQSRDRGGDGFAASRTVPRSSPQPPAPRSHPQPVGLPRQGPRRRARSPTRSSPTTGRGGDGRTWQSWPGPTPGCAPSARRSPPAACRGGSATPARWPTAHRCGRGSTRCPPRDRPWTCSPRSRPSRTARR